MRRFSALLCLLVLVGLLGLTACGGGNGTPVFGNPSTITVTPAATSLTVGTVENPNVIVADSKGTTLFTSGGTASTNVTFASSNTAIMDVATNGLVCAGKWDNEAAPVVCSAGQAGQATLTVQSGTVTSTPVTFFVHKPIARIDISGNRADIPSCLSQALVQQLTAKVFSSVSGDPTTDITSTVGPVTFTSAVPDIVAVDANGVAAGGIPGVTSIVADVGSFRSIGVPFVVCPIKSINLHVKGATDTTLNLAPAGTATLTADATDSNGQNVIISQAAAGDPGNLTVSTSSSSASAAPVPLVRSAIVPTSTNDITVTSPRSGTASIVVSCTPPNCNGGFTGGAVYSNIVTENTSGTSSSVVFVTGTDTTQLIPIPTSSNTPGTAITLSNQPNSLVIGPDGARAMLGSAGGLMVVDANALTLTTTIAGVPGKVLTVAPDGKTAVVSDTTNNRVFVGDVTVGSFQVFPIGGVTAAAYTPDQFRLYLASPTDVTMIAGGAAPKSLGFAATSVSPYTTGAFTYFASGTVPVITTCDLSRPADATGAIGATLVKALAGGTQVLAAGPSALSAIDVSVSANTSTPTGCPPGITNTPTSIAVSGTPNQIIPTSDGSRAFITNDTANIIAYSAANHSATTIPLTGATGSFTGGITLDGALLYVGVPGATGSTPVVHRIDLTANTDAQQISVSTTAFTPNLVALRP
jgi:hypothetical protein